MYLGLSLPVVAGYRGSDSAPVSPCGCYRMLEVKNSGEKLIVEACEEFTHVMSRLQTEVLTQKEKQRVRSRYVQSASGVAERCSKALQDSSKIRDEINEFEKKIAAAKCKSFGTCSRFYEKRPVGAVSMDCKIGTSASVKGFSGFGCRGAGASNTDRVRSLSSSPSKKLPNFMECAGTTSVLYPADLQYCRTHISRSRIRSDRNIRRLEAQNPKCICAMKGRRMMPAKRSVKIPRGSLLLKAITDLPYSESAVIKDAQNRPAGWSIDKTAGQTRSFSAPSNIPSRWDFLEARIARKLAQIRSSPGYKEATKKVDGMLGTRTVLSASRGTGHGKAEVSFGVRGSVSSPELTQIVQYRQMPYVKEKPCRLQGQDSKDDVIFGFHAYEIKSPPENALAGCAPQRDGRPIRCLYGRSLNNRGSANNSAEESKETGDRQLLSPETTSLLKRNVYPDLTNPKLKGRHMERKSEPSWLAGGRIEFDAVKENVERSLQTLDELTQDIEQATKLFDGTSFSERESHSPAEKHSVREPAVESFCEPSTSVFDPIAFPLFDKMEVESEGEVSRGIVMCGRLNAHIAHGEKIDELALQLRGARDLIKKRLCPLKSVESCVPPSPVHMVSYSPQRFPLKTSFKEDFMEERVRQRGDGDYCSSERKSECSVNEAPIVAPAYITEGTCFADVEMSSDARTSTGNVNDLDETLSRSRRVSTNERLDFHEKTKDLRIRQELAKLTLSALRHYFFSATKHFTLQKEQLRRAKKEKELRQIINQEAKVFDNCKILIEKYRNSVNVPVTLDDFVNFHNRETALLHKQTYELEELLSRGRILRSGTQPFMRDRRNANKIIGLTRGRELEDRDANSRKWIKVSQKRMMDSRVDHSSEESCNLNKSANSGPVKVAPKSSPLRPKSRSGSEERIKCLRTILRQKRLEADNFNEDINRRTLSSSVLEESSLLVQIEAHDKYIVESKKNVEHLNVIEKIEVGQCASPTDNRILKSSDGYSSAKCVETPKSSRQSLPVLSRSLFLENRLSDVSPFCGIKREQENKALPISTSENAIVEDTVNFETSISEENAAKPSFTPSSCTKGSPCEIGELESEKSSSKIFQASFKSSEFETGDEMELSNLFLNQVMGCDAVEDVLKGRKKSDREGIGGRVTGSFKAVKEDESTKICHEYEKPPLNRPSTGTVGYKECEEDIAIRNKCEGMEETAQRKKLDSFRVDSIRDNSFSFSPSDLVSAAGSPGMEGGESSHLLSEIESRILENERLTSGSISEFPVSFQNMNVSIVGELEVKKESVSDDVPTFSLGNSTIKGTDKEGVDECFTLSERNQPEIKKRILASDTSRVYREISSVVENKDGDISEGLVLSGRDQQLSSLAENEFSDTFQDTKPFNELDEQIKEENSPSIKEGKADKESTDSEVSVESAHEEIAYNVSIHDSAHGTGTFVSVGESLTELRVSDESESEDNGKLASVEYKATRAENLAGRKDGLVTEAPSSISKEIPKRLKSVVGQSSPPRSPLFARSFAAKMPTPQSPRSIAGGPQSPQNSARMVQDLVNNTLQTLLNDSLDTMLAVISQNGMMVTGAPRNLSYEQSKAEIASEFEQLTCSVDSHDASVSNESWLGGSVVYDLGGIEEPNQIFNVSVPSLDLSFVDATEKLAPEGSSTIADEPPPNFEKVSAAPEKEVPSAAINSSILTVKEKFFPDDFAEVHLMVSWCADELWALAGRGGPFEIVVDYDESERDSVLNDYKQMLADRCCEIAEKVFITHGTSRYLHINRIAPYRPKNVADFLAILEREVVKPLFPFDISAEKSRWEVVSRDEESAISNMVMSDLYANQDRWRNFEPYEEEVLSELASEMWREVLDQSLNKIVAFSHK